MKTQAQKEASKRYRSKTFQKTIQYNPSEAEEYQRVDEYCRERNISYQRYVKDLIHKDMECLEQERSNNQ